MILIVAVSDDESSMVLDLAQSASEADDLVSQYRSENPEWTVYSESE